MAFITWTSAISVNDEIDVQHQRLFGILNELHASVTAGAERGSLSRVFNQLIEYTVEHFQTEERWFATTGYSDAPAHTREHDELTEAVVALQKKFDEGDLVISFDLLNFLYDWLMTHTSGSDLKFASYLRGVREPESRDGDPGARAEDGLDRPSPGAL